MPRNRNHSTVENQLIKRKNIEILTGGTFTRSKVNRSADSCLLCDKCPVDIEHYEQHAGNTAFPNYDSKLVIKQIVSVTIESDVNKQFLEFKVKNKRTNKIKITKVIVLNLLLGKIDLTLTKTYVLEKDQKIIFLVNIDDLSIIENNTLVVFAEDGMEYCDTFTFMIKLAEWGGDFKYFAETVQSATVGRLETIKLNSYEPSAVVKTLTDREFAKKENETKAECDLREYIRTFSCDKLNYENFKFFYSTYIQIEDYEEFKRMFKYDIIKKLQPTGTKCVKIQLNSEKYPFLIIGDRVLLFPLNKSKKSERNFGIISQINPTGIVVKTTLPMDNTNIKYRIHFLHNRLTIQLEHYSLEKAEKLNIIKLLFPTEFDKQTEHINIKRFFNKSIGGNAEQKQAVLNILNGSSYPAPYILFGPPGTGKTRTIVESVCQILQMKPKSNILICAMSNAVCDEIVQYLMNYIKLIDSKPQMLRLYAPSAKKDNVNVDVLNLSNYKERGYPPLDIICNYRVVVSTLSVSGRLAQAQISPTHFTHIFIDECECVRETLLLLPIVGVSGSQGKINAQVVLSGDPYQLGPIVKSRTLLGLNITYSMLIRLMDLKLYQKNNKTNKYNDKVLTKLVNNYRSHPKIIEIPNALFYENEMKACGSKENIEWKFDFLPNPNFPIIFENISGLQEQDNTSWFNDDEIDLVLSYVALILSVKEQKIKQKDIGIISPYKSQCKIIKKELDYNNWGSIKVGSVEQFQGQERPIIIVTTVRSRTNSIGFVKDSKRMNVLITRAKALLIIVGNAKSLEKFVEWKTFIDFIRENNAYRNAEIATN